MLGIPTTSTLNTPVDYATSSPYYSAFAQEAWRATSKLTVNLGLRFEVEQGMTETADRMITSFDPDFVPAFANEVVAAYARAPASRSVGRGVPQESARRRHLRRPGRPEPPRLEVAGDVAAARICGLSGERGHGRQGRLRRLLRLAERDRDYAEPARLQHRDDGAVEQRLRTDVGLGESACGDLAPRRSVPGESGWHPVLDAGRQRSRRGFRRRSVDQLTATSIASTRDCSGGVRACRKSSAATWRSRWRMSARTPTTSI